MTNKSDRSNGRRILGIGVLAMGLTLSAGPAAAQIFKLCGDIDDSDSVTVSDGVQVLRAAAGLESDCTDEICDVDVNGTIGVSDGVNVLRKAAGLAITQNCIADEGNINLQVAHLVQRTQPLVSEALGTVILRKNETSDSSFPCENGGDEGTLDTTFSEGDLEISFSTCLVDNALIDGTVENANDDPLLSLEITDVRSDESIAFGSDNPLLGVNTTRGVKLSGNLTAEPTFDRFDTSDFLLVVGNLEAASNGIPLAGSITLELNDDSNVPGIRRVKIFYDGSNLPRVVVTFEDGSVKSYKFELTFRNFI